MPSVGPVFRPSDWSLDLGTASWVEITPYTMGGETPEEEGMMWVYYKGEHKCVGGWALKRHA